MSGRTGKYLAWCHGTRTSLHSVRTPCPQVKYFPVQPDLTQSIIFDFVCTLMWWIQNVTFQINFQRLPINAPLLKKKKKKKRKSKSENKCQTVKLLWVSNDHTKRNVSLSSELSQEEQTMTTIFVLDKRRTWLEGRPNGFKLKFISILDIRGQRHYSQALNSDENEISLYSITACSNIQVMRIKETITEAKILDI